MPRWKVIPRLPSLLISLLALALSASATSLALAETAPAEPDAAMTPPRLAVILAVDQFRGDYLDRFGPHFGEGGFKRLLAGGMNFTDCNYAYAMTKTAPGHATVSSGVNPDVHGIIGNDWPDPVTWKKQIAVQDDQVRLVGKPEGTPENELLVGRSPRWFLADTVGDQLKAKYGDDAKVFAVANKDRSAVLLGGRKADLALWQSDGHFITSTYYMEQLPDWVAAYNALGRVDALAGTTWERLLPDVDIYNRVQGPDEVQPEWGVENIGRTLPKTLPKADEKGSLKSLYKVYDVSPFALVEVAEITKAAVTGMGLGQDATPDLLCVSFSQIDAVGHSFGPDSHELMDSMLRLDRVVADLLSFLDEKVGAGNYTVVVTADHGVTPIPEVIKARDPNSTAERVNREMIDKTVQMALFEELGESGDRPWAHKFASSFYLNHAQLKAANIPAERAEKIIKAALLTLPAVVEAYTRADIESAPDGNSHVTMARRSYLRERSPDVSYLLKPHCLESGGNNTNHGTPYKYDTHVPLLWYGRGVSPGNSDTPVSVTHLAPTLSAILQIPAPKGAAEKALIGNDAVAP